MRLMKLAPTNTGPDTGQTVSPAEQDPAAYEVRHPRVKGAKDGGDFTEMLTHLKYFVQVLNLSSIHVH